MYKKSNKYKNKKVEYKNIIFDSIFEKDRFVELELLQKGGQIKDLELQKKFVLQNKFYRNERPVREIIYICDFFYFDNNLIQYVCEDVKGYETKEFTIKKKLFLKKYPNIVFFKNSKRNQEYL